ncbi:MAG: 4-hydroxy-tetrahydrodipicolinate synthase [Steroidobacteraceae bacterium]|nr:4-hydroxy-tetrahydrodipicolinate synthase [Steroidobacteraceae bacterium]
MFDGSLVAIVTPMRRDGSIDFDAWSRLLEFHLENGTSGIVVGGTTGESPTISEAELRELTERACAQVKRRIPVIVGVGTSSTAATVARTRWASELPIDGLLVVTPAYNRPPQEGLYRHYAAVAEASRVPVILYNIPSRTAVDLLPSTVARLMQFPQIVAVKEGVASIERVRELAAVSRAGFTILSGDDASACETMLAGARGVISVTANVAPRAMSDMVAAAVKGDRERAKALDEHLASLHRDLFLEANPIPAKWALERMGLIEGGIRLPLTPLSASHHAAVEAALRKAGVLK